ncbi:MAG: hypothetical protein NWQ38_14965 [Cellulophaga sp.]|nr:hypothetical protein [Cellulophaga sp.]
MNNKPLTLAKSNYKIPNSFWGALLIILISILPYFHDIITDSKGVKNWVPVLGIENLLTDTTNSILGFSSYRVFLYTFLIFVFATIGWLGWYRNSTTKYYSNSVLLAVLSSLYYLTIISLNLRRTLWNDTNFKLIALAVLFLVLNYLTFKNQQVSFKKITVCLLFLFIALLPFYHDIITNIDGSLKNWAPNLGIQKILTDSEGKIRGFFSYRALMYMFCIHLFSHIAWFGWFMSSQGKRYRPFLLVPVALSLYQVIVIAMSWNETEFNSPSLKLYITLGLSILLALNFFYNNTKVPQKNNVPLKTLKKSTNEN